jgi:hypothetical protein
MDLVDKAIKEEKKNDQQPEEKKEVIKEKVTEKKEESKKEDKEENREAMELLNHSKLLTKMIQEVQKRVVGETRTIQCILMAMIGGCFCENVSPTSCNILITDESGAGKDFVTWAILKIFPDDMIVRRKRITERTLTYWNNIQSNPAWTWEGKILYLEDINQKILNCEVLKTLMSSDEIINYSTIVSEHTAQDIGIKGRPCVIATTYKGNLNIETMRRVTCLFLDTSEEQTERIIKRQLNEASICTDIKPDYSLFKKTISLLKKVSVVIPYSNKIIPTSNDKDIDSRLSNRTNIQKILDAVRFSATLHQYQRLRNKKNQVIANKDDYYIAIMFIYNTTIIDYGAAITKQQKKIVDTMGLSSDSSLNFEWEINDLHAKFPELKLRTVYKHLENLCFIGAVTCKWIKDEHSGKGYNVYCTKGKMGIKVPEWNDEFNKDYEDYISKLL